MNKKIVYTFGIFLMLCSLFTLILGLGIGVGAEDADHYSLTINYATGCESVELSIPGQAVQKMESGVAYWIPKTNATITIRVILKNGYEIDSMTGNQGLYVLNDENCRTWTFTSDDVVELTCKPKEYEIKYLISESAGAHTQPATGIFPKTYTFGDEGTKISIPVLDGFKFRYWILLSSKDSSDESGIILSPKEGEDFVTLSATTLPNTDTLYLRPKWEANQYEVYRYDYIFDPLSPDKRGAMLNKTVEDIVKWKAPMKSEVDGSMGEDRVYPGFVFINSSEYFTTGSVTVSTDGEPLNIVYRLYLPLEYVLDFVSGYDEEIAFPEGAVKPEKHVYNVETPIPDPIRLGYVFQGWTVTVVKNGVETSFNVPKNLTIDDMDVAYAGDQATVIKLTALWESDKYTVHIDLNQGTDGDQYDHSEKYVYDKGLTIEQPVRPGYTFLGWLINGGTDPQTGDLAPFTYVGDITLVAQWKANEYTVTLDGMGATKPGTQSFEVIFDSPLALEGLVLPEKEGHEFLGFATADGKFYVDAEGKSLVSVWDIPENTTLQAQWKVLSYKVTVNATNSKIYLNDILYEGTPIEFPYGTTVNVVIKAAATHKVTAWEGKAVGHTHEFRNSFVLGAADVVLDAVVLPMIAPPAFDVDYVGELFTTAENGTYQISCGSETLSIRVTEGKIYVNEVEVSAIAIPESFFGKTVEIVAFGDKTATADSDPVPVPIAARPELPLQNDHIGSIYPGSIESIVITRNPDSTYAYEYEFAVSLKPDGTGLSAWKTFAELSSPKENTYLLEGLNPGTIYYVYARVKASEGNYPHGQVNMTRTNTTYDDYLKQKTNELQNLIEETDGDIVKALIAKAIEDAKALETPSETFYEDLEGIYKRVLIAVPFARQQDNRIAELRNLRDALIATEEFSTESNNLLNDLCSTAVSSITTAKTSDEVESIYLNAVTGMKAVKVTYLFYEHARLLSFAGLPQETKLLVQRMSDITALTNAVNEAFASGKLAVAGDSMTLEEALEAFRSLDVMAGFTLRLSKNDTIYTTYDGKYEIRVLLPEDLWGVSGLQVAYYDDKAGIEVLDTERDGNYLIFSADRLDNFVILGDPTLNMTVFIMTLGLILACQLIAIILLLARRVKSVRASYHASIAFPLVALTIRFLPENGMLLAMILGVLVVLLQIILMYLLLSTDVIPQRRERRVQSSREGSKSVPTMAESEETADTTEFDEGYIPAVLSVEGEDQVDPESVVDDSTNEEDGVFVNLRTGEVFGDTDKYDDFIEPAANPRYSLPDEEYAAYEESGDSFESSVEGADEDVNEDSTEVFSDGAEWQYDDEIPTEDALFDAEESFEQESSAEDDGFVFEPDYEDEIIDEDYDDSVRGEPAEDLPQEEPVMGYPADDIIEDEPIRGDLPEYEQSVEKIDTVDETDEIEENDNLDETKKYDGYEA